MPARGLDCFPSWKSLEQFAQQGRLPNVGSEATNTDNHWLVIHQDEVTFGRTELIRL